MNAGSVSPPPRLRSGRSIWKGVYGRLYTHDNKAAGRVEWI